MSDIEEGGNIVKNLITRFVVVVAALVLISPVYASPYDGNWIFSIKTLRGSGCSANPGRIVIDDGKITGSMVSEGREYGVTGKVSDDGKVRGKVGGGLANFKGTMTTSSGSGTWKNRFSCSGTMAIRR